MLPDSSSNNNNDDDDDGDSDDNEQRTTNADDKVSVQSESQGGGPDSSQQSSVQPQCRTIGALGKILVAFVRSFIRHSLTHCGHCLAAAGFCDFRYFQMFIVRTVPTIYGCRDRGEVTD